MSESTFQFHDVVIDTETAQVKRSDQLIPLTPLEYKLFDYLLSHKGTVVSREKILKYIWQYADDIETRVVDVYIGYLRKKIDGTSPRSLIRTIRGVGYMIEE